MRRGAGVRTVARGFEEIELHRLVANAQHALETGLAGERHDVARYLFVDGEGLGLPVSRVPRKTRSTRPSTGSTGDASGRSWTGDSRRRCW